MGDRGLARFKKVTMPAKCCGHGRRGPVQAPAPPPPHLRLRLHPLQGRQGAVSTSWLDFPAVGLGAAIPHATAGTHACCLQASRPQGYQMVILHLHESYFHTWCSQQSGFERCHEKCPAQPGKWFPRLLRGGVCLVNPATPIACSHTNPLVCIGPLNLTIVHDPHPGTSWHA